MLIPRSLQKGKERRKVFSGKDADPEKSSKGKGEEEGLHMHGVGKEERKGSEGK